MMLDQPFVAVAVRATTDSAATARLVELGLVQIGGGRVGDPWAPMPDPSVPGVVDAWALRFDPGIPGFSVPEGRAFAMYARAIASFGRGRRVVAWDTVSSVAVLRSELRRCRIETGARPPIDLRGSLARLEPELGATVVTMPEAGTPGTALAALTFAAEALGVQAGKAVGPEVLDEALLTWRVFEALARRHPHAFEETPASAEAAR